MSFQESIGSGEKTASAVIVAEPCWITGIEVISNGTNDATAILYDNASASATGDKIIEMVVVGADNYGGKNWDFPRKCNHGIYAVLSGTGPSCIVEYIITPER